MIALSSEAIDPTKRIQSIVLPLGEVRLLKVIGIIFDTGKHYVKNAKGEAYLQQNYHIPKISIAFKVRGESALPLALPNQIVLGGETILPDKLDKYGGSIVALLFDGKEALKRIGASVPGAPHVRLFEHVGGLGKSILVRIEEVEDDPFCQLPVLQKVIKIVGVLYNHI